MRGVKTRRPAASSLNSSNQMALSGQRRNSHADVLRPPCGNIASPAPNMGVTVTGGAATLWRGRRRTMTITMAMGPS